MNNKITARGMAEGVLMAALAAIFMLAGNLPFIGLFVLLFCSIPITVATVRNNPFIGGLSAVLAVILALLFLGPIAAISGGLQYMLLGWVLGYMLYHHKSSNKTIGAGVITAASAALVILLFTLGLIGFTPASITAYMDNYTADMMEMYQSTGMIDMMAQQGVSKTQVAEIMEQSVQLMMRLMPSILIISRSVMAVITYFLTVQVLKRLKIRIPRIQNFQKWGLPFGFVWGLIIVWALWLAADYIDISWLNILTLNFLIVYAALLFLDGFALTCYWFKFEQMSTPMKVLGVLFVLFFITGFLIACTFMGLADLLFDFRKLRVDNKKVRKG